MLYVSHLHEKTVNRLEIMTKYFIFYSFKLVIENTVGGLPCNNRSYSIKFQYYAAKQRIYNINWYSMLAVLGKYVFVQHAGNLVVLIYF